MGRQQSSAYSQGGMYGNQPGMGNRAGLSPQQTTGANTVGGNQSSFQNRLNQIVARAARGTSAEEVEVLEDAKIVPDPKSNTLLIYAHKRDLAMITNIVAKLDVMQAQVLIEAVVFEISLGDSLNLGVSMAQSPKRFGQDFTGAGGVNNGQPLLNNLTNFPNALPSGMSYFGKIGQDLDVTFQAIAANSDVNVVSRPRIQTSHAIPGAFFVGEQIPYPSASTYDYGFYGGGVNSSPYQRSQINYLDVGFNLNVTPYITPEGYVVMEIVQEFSNKTRDVLIDSNPIPSVAQRSAEATLTVRDGQTIMLGGFISERKSKSKSGVPLLKDIPGLGALFRSSNNQNDRTELVVLMRARVLHTPEQAYEVAEQEKATLLGVQNAEREMEKSDEKRRRKMKK
jgi:general secretion pathway protein D